MTALDISLTKDDMEYFRVKVKFDTASIPLAVSELLI